MSASTIFFNGRLISIPGSYSEIDASGLDQVGLTATGIVAILGEAVGGMPASDMAEAADFHVLNKPEDGRRLFQSGPLREAVDMAFAPSRDPDVPGGAVQVIAMKVNPATQSTATLSNAYGNCLDLTSADYGAFTTQVNITVANGTNKGKLITVTYEDSVETGDDVSGDIMFNLKYIDSDGWETMTAEVESTGDIVCNGTRDEIGKSPDITQLGGASLVEVVSAGADTAQVVVYGLTAAGAVQSETFTLNGATPVPGSLTFLEVHGARIIGTTANIVTVQSSPGAVAILTIAAGTSTTKGLWTATSMFVANTTVSSVAGGACTDVLLLVGKSATGATQLEKITMNGTTPVVSTLNFSELDYLVVGDIANTVTVTWSAEAARADADVQDTIQKAADHYNSKCVVSGTDGFVFTIVTGNTSLEIANLDITTGAGGAVTCLSPADPAFYADLYYIADWITNSSEHMNAAVSSGAVGGAPTNTTAAVFLSGGVEGSTSASNWLDALNLLKKTRVNSVVVLTHLAAIHAYVDAHCVHCCGIGRSERDGVVGLKGNGTTVTALSTKAEAKAQIVDLNSRHIRAWAQSIERYGTDGTRQTFDPMYGAVLIAGMQAGSPIGMPLTRKYMNTLSLAQSTGATGWNPTDDAEDMIQAGLCFAENVPGTGRRIVRNVTTHLSTTNLAFQEGSVNEAVNYAAYTFRSNMEVAVGKRGFAGTVNATKGVAVTTLGLLVDELILVAHRSLAIELLVDVLSVEVEMAPILPINFVKNTIHLVTIPQTAV